MHAHVHNHVRSCTYVYLHMTECMHVWCVCVYVCVYVWMYVCMFAFMRAGVHICMYVCVCLHIYMCVYICAYIVCICIYMYMYIDIDIYTQNVLLDLLYSISWLFILLCYNPICWCWKASRNIYFEQTQEELLFYIQNTFVYLYIRIFFSKIQRSLKYICWC